MVEARVGVASAVYTIMRPGNSMEGKQHALHVFGEAIRVVFRGDISGLSKVML